MNERGKEVDTTFLSIDTVEERGFIHRDYIAHCLRWSHFVKRLFKGHAYKTARVLDVGCGRETPLAKTLYSSRLIVKEYVGVDYGPINNAAFHTGKFPITLFPKQDFATLDLQGAETEFSHMVSFEMLEHVEPKHAIAILRKMWKWATPETTIFISTPIWDGVNTAANHVNEIKYHALGWLLEELGFHIEDAFGTFASQKDYVHKMAPAHRESFDDLSSYYDSNLLSCIFAPFYPEQSRNALWVLKKSVVPMHRMFSHEMLVACAPWGSSHNWKDLGESHVKPTEGVADESK